MIGNFYATHNNIRLENFIVDEFDNLVQIIGWEYAAVLPPTFELDKLRLLAEELDDMNCNCSDINDLRPFGIN